MAMVILHDQKVILHMDHHLHLPTSNTTEIGILKNRSTSDTHEQTPQATPFQEPTQDERDLVLQNTLHNAGAGHRRSSSHPSQPSASRRQSGSVVVDGENSPRLKWDEANLYLAEQEREAAGARMKIDEPKTPYATRYDPTEDEMMDGAGLTPDGLLVDEVDKKLLMSRERDIPDLDIGEAEVSVDHVPTEEKRVMVEENMDDADDDVKSMRHGESGEYVSEEEKEKHRHFEEMRKKHYEMRNIKNLLGYV
jgi:protein phosphatase inhibitor 2